MDRYKSIKKIKDVDTLVNKYETVTYPTFNRREDDIYIISKIGDRLDLLANDFYGNSRYWWVISRSNPGKIKSDSFFIDPGLQIRIPNNVTDAYSVFDSINK